MITIIRKYNCYQPINDHSCNVEPIITFLKKLWKCCVISFGTRKFHDKLISIGASTCLAAASISSSKEPFLVVLNSTFNQFLLLTLGSFMINWWALACLAAASISSSVEPSLPYRMFSLTVVLKSTGSWPTRPIWARSHCTDSSRTSLLSTDTCRKASL